MSRADNIRLDLSFDYGFLKNLLDDNNGYFPVDIFPQRFHRISGVRFDESPFIELDLEKASTLISSLDRSRTGFSERSILLKLLCSMYCVMYDKDPDNFEQDNTFYLWVIEGLIKCDSLVQTPNQIKAVEGLIITSASILYPTCHYTMIDPIDRVNILRMLSVRLDPVFENIECDISDNQIVSFVYNITFLHDQAYGEISGSTFDSLHPVISDLMLSGSNGKLDVNYRRLLETLIYVKSDEDRLILGLLTGVILSDVEPKLLESQLLKSFDLTPFENCFTLKLEDIVR